MKKLLVLVVSVVLIGLSQNAYAFVNGGFEAGNLSGWSATVPSGGSASAVTSFSSYGPVEGSYFALLKTDGPGSYTTLSQTFTGSWIEGWAAFKAGDYWPLNDNAAVWIYDASNTVVAQPWYSDVATVGDYGSTPWQHWSWTMSSSGNYTVEYRVANYGDSILDSHALFDATTVVPEPATLSLLSLGFLGFGFARRKKRGTS